MRLFLIAFLAPLLFTTAATAEEPFQCPEGTKDSGYQVGNIVRWCEVSKEGRLLYHGPLLRWHRNGQLSSREFYEYGNAIGDWQAWHENGKPSSKGSMANGYRIGAWQFWHEQGWLKTTADYGAERNHRVEYFPTGKKHYEGDFARGKKVGLWTEWSESGTELRRCDFGDGLFKLPPGACKDIAEKLDPRGFSLPIAKVVPDSAGNMQIVIANERYRMQIPEGWRLEAEATKRDGVPFAILPAGGKWKDDGDQMYARVLYREGRSFSQTAKEALDEIEGNVPNYKGEKRRTLKTAKGKDAVIQKLSYNSSYGTDSPFTIVTEAVRHETISVVDLSSNVSLMLVLTSTTDASRSKSQIAMEAVLKSVESIGQR